MPCCIFCLWHIFLFIILFNPYYENIIVLLYYRWNISAQCILGWFHTKFQNAKIWVLDESISWLHACIWILVIRIGIMEVESNLSIKKKNHGRWKQVFLLVDRILFMWRKWQTTCFFIALSKNGVAYYFFSFGSGVGSSVGGHLLSWHDSFVEGKKKKSWGPTPLCLMWTLWKERNKRAFNNVELFDQTIKYAFLYTFGI